MSLPLSSVRRDLFQVYPPNTLFTEANLDLPNILTFSFAWTVAEQIKHP